MIFEITLIAHEYFSDIFTGELIDLKQPILYISETLFIGDIVDQDDSVCALVVGTGDWIKSRLLVLKRSWPAVSQICIFTCFPCRSKVRILKSTPIVGRKDSLKTFSEKRSSKDDLPTEEFPTNNSLNK